MSTLNFKLLKRIDFKILPIMGLLMLISLLTIHSYSQEEGYHQLLTPVIKQQLVWFFVGSLLFILLVCFDYNKLREWTWGLYLLMLLALVGLFFSEPIQNVHRWYRLPFIGASFQPSECAKLITVITLSWYLEKKKSLSESFSTAFFGGIIVLVPFILILKQPDLGTALVLIPITLVMFYFGKIHPLVIKTSSYLGLAALIFLALKFSGFIDHENFRPFATQFIKEYQYERLDPNTHHQKAAASAIAMGGLLGAGKGKSEFVATGWLPAAYTDSVFPAFGEEFGLVGLFILIGTLYKLVSLSFKVSLVAKDPFGKLLACGISVYLAMHIIINMGMMIGLLPITGVPLVLVTYGGSSILSTMAALGILQSIYARRFMF